MKVQVSYGADLEDVPSITHKLTCEVAENLEMLASVLRDSEAELVGATEYDLQNLQLFAQRAGTVQADLARLSDRLTDCYKLIRGYYQVIERPVEEVDPPVVEPEEDVAPQSETTEVMVEDQPPEVEDV